MKKKLKTSAEVIHEFAAEIDTYDTAQQRPDARLDRHVTNTRNKRHEAKP